MIEYDCLEDFNEDIDFEIEYDKIYWENKIGWEHYLEYDIFQEYIIYEYEYIGEEFFQYEEQSDYLKIGTNISKIIDFNIGYDYHNINGYYVSKYNGLHLTLENGERKLWYADTMKIIKKPGKSLNRNIKINELLNH